MGVCHWTCYKMQIGVNVCGAPRFGAGVEEAALDVSERPEFADKVNFIMKAESF